MCVFDCIVSAALECVLACDTAGEELEGDVLWRQAQAPCIEAFWQARTPQYALLGATALKWQYMMHLFQSASTYSQWIAAPEIAVIVVTTAKKKGNREAYAIAFCASAHVLMGNR